MNQQAPPPPPVPPQAPGSNPYMYQVSRLNMASAKMQRYKLLFRRRWWLLLLAASIGICYQAWKVSNEPIRYVSSARLVAGGQINVAKGPHTYSESGQDFYGTAIEILQSGEVRKRAADRVEALNPGSKRTAVSLNVVRPAGASILNISATGDEPKYTVAYLNALLDEFISYRREARAGTTDVTLNSITEELLRLEKFLKDEETKLVEFLQNNNLILLEEGGNQAAKYLGSLNSRKTSIETELSLLDLLDLDADIRRRSELAQRPDAAATLPAVGGEDLPEGLSDLPAIDYKLSHGERSYLSVSQEVELLKVERTGLLRNLKPLHPSVLDVEERMEKQRVLLDIYREQSNQERIQRKDGLKIQIKNLENQVVRWEAEALDMSAKLAEHARIEDGLDRIRKRYDGLLTLLQDIDINESLQNDFIEIMERASGAAETQAKLVRPILMGLILGLIAGLLVIVVFDKLDDRMNSFSEFQTHFSEDVLGQIPEQNFRGGLALLQPNDERHLYAEAFRNIRSSILFKNWEGGVPKRIIVTSAVPNEGKTTTTANLAITMALSGAKVLLVDSDLRRGGMNEILGQSSTPGFSEVLTDRMAWRDVVRSTETENLSFIARGEALEQTSEYLLSKKCDLFLAEVGGEYDFVIFDSAPVLVADDTASFAPKADTTLFVVRMSSTMARLAAKALGQLYDRQVNVGGVILNRASTSLKEYSYYNYANYYTVRPTTAQ
jgi:polysaccharide biosynthesis transport protein